MVLLLVPLEAVATETHGKIAVQSALTSSVIPQLRTAPSSAKQVAPATQEPLTGGMSLFDKLFLNNNELRQSYNIPHPFSKLVDSLESRLGVSVNNDANQVRLALIPLGRCINRYAASPDYFRYPRVVLAIDSEHVGHSVTDYLPLKDRLFLGYRENPGIMEVISYNTEAGRFDFQIVTGYSQDSIPIVRNAARDSCTSCHQNEGPIFPQSPYRETDKNPELLRKILAAQGVATEKVTTQTRNEASSVDSSVNRANMFSLSQTVWTEGCRSTSRFRESRCRAGLFETILRARLADIYRIQTPTALTANFLIPVAEENVRDRWPSGITLHNSDIPTQSPLSLGEKAHLASAELLKVPRKKTIAWRPDDLYRIVQGLGDFIPKASIRRLDQTLHQAAVSTRSSGENIEEGCRLKMSDRANWQSRKSGLTGELSINCSWPKSDLSPEISLFADIRIVNGVVRGYPHSGMAMGGDDFILSLAHGGGQVVRKNEKFTIAFDLYDSENYLHARMPDGRIIERIVLQWDRAKLTQSYRKHDGTFNGKGTLTLLENLGALDDAITTLVDLQDQGRTDVFSDKPFDAGKAMQAVFSAL